MGNETVAVYDPRLLDDIPAWVIENIQAVSAYMKTRGHEEWTIAGVRSQAAHAREVEALRQRAEAAEADARRWRHVRDEMTYHYGDGQTEPRECGIHLEWVQGPWVRDGSNGGSGRPDWFPGWDTIVDEEITKLADELQELDDAAISGDDGEIVPSGCGVEARIHFEDPRYPTLVLDGDEFGTIGYELRRDTGELRRVCICHAHCEHECVCGYDAAISAERDNTRSDGNG